MTAPAVTTTFNYNPNSSTGHACDPVVTASPYADNHVVGRTVETGGASRVTTHCYNANGQIIQTWRPWDTTTPTAATANTDGSSVEVSGVAAGTVIDVQAQSVDAHRTSSQYVCVSGSASGGHCGKVIATRQDAQNYGTIDLCGIRGGDSGGPVVSAGSARGIMVRGTFNVLGEDRCRVDFQSARIAQTLLDVQIMTHYPHTSP